MEKIRLRLNKNSYDIIICLGEIQKLGRCLRQLKIGRDAVIVTNQAIKNLFGTRIEKTLVSAGFNVRFELVPDSERAKSEKECLRLLNSISEFDSLGRRIFIVALGGGVVGDLAGFTASIFKRGVPYIQVPTTLLSQVDSAIGGKTAIDLSVGKNLAGAFYQPRLVFSDVSFLDSLPTKELISGLAEVIKYGIIKSPGLFRFIENNFAEILNCDKKSLQRIVYECSLIKARIVERDEKDNKNIRVVLNLGHTIGHAIETSVQYSGRYSHGQAVALGMLSAIYISKRLGLSSENLYTRVKGLFDKIGLACTLKGLKQEDVLSALRHDKKFIHGKTRLVLPVRIGKVIVKENVPEALIKESILHLRGLSS